MSLLGDQRLVHQGTRTKPFRSTHLYRKENKSHVRNLFATLRTARFNSDLSGRTFDRSEWATPKVCRDLESARPGITVGSPCQYFRHTGLSFLRWFSVQRAQPSSVRANVYGSLSQSVCERQISCFALFRMMRWQMITHLAQETHKRDVIAHWEFGRVVIPAPNERPPSAGHIPTTRRISCLALLIR